MNVEPIFFSILSSYYYFFHLEKVSNWCLNFSLVHLRKKKHSRQFKVSLNISSISSDIYLISFEFLKFGFFSSLWFFFSISSSRSFSIHLIFISYHLSFEVCYIYIYYNFFVSDLLSIIDSNWKRRFTQFLLPFLLQRMPHCLSFFMFED